VLAYEVALSAFMLSLSMTFTILVLQTCLWCTGLHGYHVITWWHDAVLSIYECYAVIENPDNTVKFW